MKNILSSSLLDVLSTINNGSFVSVHSLTEPKMKKTGNPLNGHKVQKMTIQTLQWGYCYQNAVNNRISEGEFVAEPLAWGEWLIPNKVISHKGKLYARFYKVDNESAKPNTLWLVDGAIATEEEESIIKAFLVESSYSARQAEVGLTEHQVKPRNFGFDSIIGLAVNGEMYNVVSESVAVATA